MKLLVFYYILLLQSLPIDVYSVMLYYARLQIVINKVYDFNYKSKFF